MIKLAKMQAFLEPRWATHFALWAYAKDKGQLGHTGIACERAVIGTPIVSSFRQLTNFRSSKTPNPHFSSFISIVSQYFASVSFNMNLNTASSKNKLVKKLKGSIALENFLIRVLFVLI